MPTVHRVLAPSHAVYGVAGPHVFGDVTVEFDADGVAEVTDPATLELMQQFPGSFVVAPPAEGPPPSADPSAVAAETARAVGYSVHELDQMAVADLVVLARAAEIPGASNMRKGELVRAILAAQRG
jgi:hypothetical protein